MESNVSTKKFLDVQTVYEVQVNHERGERRKWLVFGRERDHDHKTKKKNKKTKKKKKERKERFNIKCIIQTIMLPVSYSGKILT